MSSRRITLRVPDSLVKRLKKHADMKGRSESSLVRDALENYLEQVPISTTAYEMAIDSGLIGCAKRLPSDLSRNRKHFEGFGER